MIEKQNAHRHRQMIGFVLLGIIFTVAISFMMLNSVIAQEASPTPEILPTPTLVPVLDRQFDFGVHIRETQPSVDEEVLVGYFDAARNQLNLNWVKVQMRWDFIETEPGVFNWEIWDRVFRLAAEDDLKVMTTILGSPLWTREPEADPNLIAPPQDHASYAAFVTEVLRRYPNQIHGVEIWDEMNFRKQWADPAGLDAAIYVQMASLAAEAIRAADPNIIIISGGLEPTSGGDAVGATDDFVYMDALIEAGLLDIVDCVGVHHNGYNIGPDVPWDTVPHDDTAVFRGPFENPHHSWSFFTTLNTYARKIAAQGKERGLCVTEFGWASTEDLDGTPLNLEFAADNTLEELSTWTLQSINLMQEWDFVWLAFLWNMNVGPEEGFNPQNDSVAYSLIRPEYTLSPAWLPIAEINFRKRVR